MLSSPVPGGGNFFQGTTQDSSSKLRPNLNSWYTVRAVIRILIPTLLCTVLSAQEEELIVPPKPKTDAKQTKEQGAPLTLMRQVFDKVRVGGYFDIEYHDRDVGDTFRQHRLIVLMKADIDENITLDLEIEYEDGAQLEVEFATLDYRIRRGFNLRGGLVLDPLGRLNLYHDSPLQEFTDRPMMHRSIIPTTLREPGFGFFGSLMDAEKSSCSIDYELYGTTGFKGLDASNNAFFTTGSGLRSGAPFKKTGTFGENRDNNDDIAFVGRLSAKGDVGEKSNYELGLSFHTGDYDPMEDNRLTIYAADARLQVGDVEFLGEYAYADIERDANAIAAGIPGDMWGYYAQVGWHFYPNFLDTLEEKGLASEGARLTVLARYGETDIAGFGKERVSLGLNFRPNAAKTVFKFSYQWNGESGSQPSVGNDGFVASLATYF